MINSCSPLISLISHNHKTFGSVYQVGRVVIISVSYIQNKRVIDADTSTIIEKVLNFHHRFLKYFCDIVVSPHVTEDPTRQRPWRQ